MENNGMDINEHFFEEEFDNYLRNKMDTNEKQDFEKNISQDEVLNKKFQIHKDLHSGLLNIYKEEFIDNLKEIDANHPPRIQKVKLIQPWMKYAASIVILVGTLFFLTNKDNSKELYHKYYSHNPSIIPINARGGNLDEHYFDLNQKDFELIKRAVVLYERKDFSLALESFTTFNKAYPNNFPKAKLMEGTCLMELKLYDKALDMLKPLEKHYLNNNGSVSWLIALSYLGKGDQKNCIKYLKTEVQNEWVNVDSRDALLNDLQE
ncbi:tetratricopeptide repeat protein [Labilibacter marinus]|uniref:tetratricopeptide repeat protein n=1 Tax=Labilibacter marinus TaxID=1477105 RepID=UPI00094FC92E|nr:hypothetical protein [Labilibacter marinus]